jgi:hypothetical protein
VLDAMQVGQRKGKTFSLFGRDKLIDVDRMNRLLTLVIATTVAKGLPTSGETREKDISHDSLSSYHASIGRQHSLPLKRPRPSRFSLPSFTVTHDLELSLIPLWLSITGSVPKGSCWGG